MAPKSKNNAASNKNEGQYGVPYYRKAHHQPNSREENALRILSGAKESESSNFRGEI
jgi:hypothetical protein